MPSDNDLQVEEMPLPEELPMTGAFEDTVNSKNETGKADPKESTTASMPAVETPAIPEDSVKDVKESTTASMPAVETPAIPEDSVKDLKESMPAVETPAIPEDSVKDLKESTTASMPAVETPAIPEDSIKETTLPPVDEHDASVKSIPEMKDSVKSSTVKSTKSAKETTTKSAKSAGSKVDPNATSVRSLKSTGKADLNSSMKSDTSKSGTRAKDPLASSMKSLSSSVRSTKSLQGSSAKQSAPRKSAAPAAAAGTAASEGVSASREGSPGSPPTRMVEEQKPDPEVERLLGELDDLENLHRDVVDGEAERQVQSRSGRAKVEEAERQNSALKSEKEQLQREIEEATTHRKEKLERMQKEMDDLIALAHQGVDVEENFKDIDPIASAESLFKICESREEELEKLYQQLYQLERENLDASNRVKQVKEQRETAIPEMIQRKKDELWEIEHAWADDERKLMRKMQELTKLQRELDWHFKRGSYIKQKHVDPRVAGQFGTAPNKGGWEFPDHRIQAWEEKLCRDWATTNKEYNDLKLQKVALATELEEKRRKWEGYSKEGKFIEGSRPWFEARIQFLKTQISREDKLTKELANENNELKTVKQALGEKIKGTRRQCESLLAENSRLMLENRMMEEEELKRIEREEREQSKIDAARQPRQITDAPSLGKKHFQ